MGLSGWALAITVVGFFQMKKSILILEGVAPAFLSFSATGFSAIVVPNAQVRSAGSFPK
jgi:hypothetical protein